MGLKISKMLLNTVYNQIKNTYRFASVTFQFARIYLFAIQHKSIFIQFSFRKFLF